MKKILTIAVIALTLSACNDNKKQEKALQQQILDFHDKVMGDDEKAMVNKMKLDTLIHKADSLKTDKQQLSQLSTQLIKADDAMSDWMKGFSLDYTGKSHDEIMTYLQQQQVKVKQVDSVLVDATTASAAYLDKIKKK